MVAEEWEARERLVDTIFHDFFVLAQQALLAGEDVPREALAADIGRVEAEVVKLANALFAAGGPAVVVAAGYESPFRQGQGGDATPDIPGQFQRNGGRGAR